MNIAQKIRYLRQENQLSQESLASLLEISRQSVSKWEQGQSVPSTENLARLSEIFEISFEDLVNNNIQITSHYSTLDFFRNFWKNKWIKFSIILLLIGFIVTLSSATYLREHSANQVLTLTLVTVSGSFALLIYLVFMIAILNYAFYDCKARGIRPLKFMILSITIIGLTYYLLRRDELSARNEKGKVIEYDK